MRNRAAALLLMMALVSATMVAFFGVFASQANTSAQVEAEFMVYLPLLMKDAKPSDYQPADLFKLTLLHTNDVHGRVDQSNRNGAVCTEADFAANLCVGGAPRLATKVQEIRANNANVLLLDAGDQFQGTLFYNLFKSDVVTKVMNAVGYDAMAIGNHEFDDGPTELARLIAGVDFPVLSANVDASADPDLKGKILPSTVITVSGEPIGIVGLTAEDTPATSSPGPTIKFNSSATSLQQAVDQLTAQGIDKIIALTHNGYTEDIKLAKAVHGVDVFVGGHSHSFLYSPTTPITFTTVVTPVSVFPQFGALQPIGQYPTIVTKSMSMTTTGGVTMTHSMTMSAPVLIVTAYQWSTFLGNLELVFGPGGVVQSYGGNPIFLGADVKPDPVLDAILQPYRDQLLELTETVVGTVTVDLPIDANGSRICRVAECLLGDLVADAMLWKANQINPDKKVHIAFENGGGMRAPLISGTVSLGDVMDVLPFGNTLATFDLKGSDVRLALENGVSAVETESGRFAQVAGMRYTFDLSKAVGSRIVSAEVMSGTTYVPLDDNMIYTIVTNDFMRRGGDSYTVFNDKAIDPYDFGPDLDDSLAEYLTEFSPLTPTIEGRAKNVTP